MPIKMTARKTIGGYFEILAETNAVNSTFLHYILDEIEKSQIRRSGQYLKVLLEVVAPELDVSLMEGLDVFRRATVMGLRGSQVAYVISGRPLGITAITMEAIARKRGIHLRFFADRDCALEWLAASATESGRVA
jgi:hypothetical protein